MSSANPFYPSRVIVLAELSTREKEKYYQALLTNKAKYHRDEKGRYVASIRLLAPGLKKEAEIKKVTSSGKESVPLEDRLDRLQNDYVTAKIVGVEEFDYSIYSRFSLLIAVNGDVVRPKPQSLFWLMKRIESLYDARFVHEKMDVERDDISLSENATVVSIFPVFIVKRFSTEKGLIKTIVDQNCWDLLYNVHVYRHDYLEVEIFARFLQEFYDNDDLLFYLYVRSVISKVLNVSFKSRWGKADGPARQPKGLWMSYRECVQVARIVFGVQNETMWHRFLEIINPQMVGQKTETADTRRIDITQFLHLAVVGYHQTVPPGESNNQSVGHTIRQSGPNSYPGMVDPSDNGDTNEDEYLGHSEQAQAFPWDRTHADNRRLDNKEAQLYSSGMPNQDKDRYGVTESKDTPHMADDGFYEYPNDDVGEMDMGMDDYGSSLDAYLAALSADENGQKMPVELLAGSQRSVQSEIPPPPPAAYSGRENNEQESDADDMPEPPPPSGGLSPGAAIAVHAAMKAANVAGDVARKGAPGSSKPGLGIQVHGLNSPAYYSVTTPSLPSQPRLDQPGSNKQRPAPSLQGNSYLNEQGQWQDDDADEHHQKAFRGLRNIGDAAVDFGGNIASLTDLASSTYAPSHAGIPHVSVTSEIYRNNVNVRFQREEDDVNTANIPISDIGGERPEDDEGPDEAYLKRQEQYEQQYGSKPVTDIMSETKSFDIDEAAKHSRTSVEESTATSEGKIGLLHSYQSGYGFDEDELNALRIQDALDEQAEAKKANELPAVTSEGVVHSLPEVGAAGGGAELDNLDAFASLQLEREREFLSYVCTPLAELPEQIAEGMVDELATHLRSKVCSYIFTCVQL
jgi:hypothetical protein